VWLKLEWAKRHTDALKADIQRWCDAESKRLTAWTLIQNFKADKQCIVIALGSVELPANCMLMLGDAVYNLRACLNYLAWDAIRVGSEPNPKHPLSVEFPIFIERDKFYHAVKSRLPGISDKLLAVIERHQPYHVASGVAMVPGPASPPIAGPASHPLAILQTLSNSDKHHNPQRTFPQNYGQLSFDIIGSTDFVSERLEPATPFPAVFYTGAEIATAYGKAIGTNPHMDVKLQGSIGIAIEPGLWLWDALDKIVATLVELIREIEPLL